ncbi:MAG: alpha/beta fold hydrolase [Bacteroidia bacterium]
MYQPFELSKNPEGTSRTITTKDNCRIYTLSAGEGPVSVLLAHGYGFALKEWNIIMPQLVNKGYQVVAFDQRGHGQSTIGEDGVTSLTMAKDYAAVIEAYELQSCIIVGHSMGGFLTMRFLLAFPELQNTVVKAAVLMATFAGDVYRKNFQNRIQIPLIKSGILQRLIKIKAIGNAFGKTLVGSNPDPELIRMIPEIFNQQDHKPLIPILAAFGDENYYDQLDQIKIPCKIIVGDKDKTTPPFHTDDLARFIPNNTRIDVPNKGHCLNAESPEVIIEAVEALAKELLKQPMS